MGIIVLANCIAFLLITIASFIIIKAIKDNNIISVMSQKLNDNASTRKTNEENIALEEGNVEKHNRMFQLDILLEQSGIKKYIKFINAEIFLILIVFVALISFVISYIFLSSSIICIAIAVIMAAATYFCVVILADNNYRKIEKQIMTFINILENYTKTTDDIIDVFGKVYPFLEEPLSSAVQECYTEAYSTGNYRVAFQHLQVKISHERLKEILRNLEICSRHEANYDVIVEESRNSMRDYLKSKKEQRVMAQNFASELLLYTVVGGVALSFVDKLISASLMDLIFNTFIGNILVLVLAGVYIYSIFSIISISRK